MTRDDTAPVLVTGSTGVIGRLVVDQLLDADVPVRALTRTPETATFPSAVDVAGGDFSIPESLEPALQGVSAVFLVWTLPFDTATRVVERLARHTRRLVFLSAPHRTPHPFFQQPNPMATLRRARATVCGQRTGNDDRPTRCVLLECAELVGADDQRRQAGALAVRGCRDCTDR
jgi:hypothetical protein